MELTRSDRVKFDYRAMNLVRILISSCFMANALGLIDGPDRTSIFATVLPAEIAMTVSSVWMFSLSWLVLTGFLLRPAALLLSLTVFYSAFIAHLSSGLLVPIAFFWYDLALIGALMMTYVEHNPRDRRRRAFIRRQRIARRIMPRRVDPSQAPLRISRRPDPAVAEAMRNACNGTPGPTSIAGKDTEKNIFRDCFDSAA